MAGGYTYVFRMVVLLRLGHSAHVDLHSLCDWIQVCSMLCNWRYVIDPYQDSPFCESMVPIDVLCHIGFWCVVICVLVFGRTLLFGPFDIYGLVVPFGDVLVVRFWSN